MFTGEMKLYNGKVLKAMFNKISYENHGDHEIVCYDDGWKTKLLLIEIERDNVCFYRKELVRSREMVLERSYTFDEIVRIWYKRCPV